MALREFRFTGLTGGVYASANIFDQPKGTLPYLSNMLLSRRGGLRTVDGSHVICRPAGSPPYPPIAFMAQYNPSGVSGSVARLFGITLDADNNSEVIDLSLNTWNGIFGGPFPNAGPNVSAVQFSNSMVFALGLNVAPQLYNPIQNPGLVTIANTFQATTTYPPWLNATAYSPGNKVLAAPAGSSISYIWTCVHGGTSGAGTPSWTAGYKSRVQDNNVIWRNDGPAGAEAPIGAGFVFNHLNSLWVWGTGSTYVTTGPNAGIDGPDSLRMSGSGNPTSFDPSDQDFVGQGDGQSPMGGGSFSLLEVGIPATAQLVLYKTLSTYSVIGSFPNVTIAQIPDGVGCAAPNTNQPVPGIGLMRLSMYGFAVFNGTRDIVDQYTDPIRPFLFPEDSGIGFIGEITPVEWDQISHACATQTVNPPGYLCLVPLMGSNGALKRGFFFDRLLKAWTVIDFPDGMQIAGSLFNIAQESNPTTLISGFSDGIIRQIFAGDEFWDTDEPNGAMIQWRIRYPAAGAPGSPLYYRRGMLRAQITGAAANLRSAYMRYTERSGQDVQDPLPLQIDQNGPITQSIDIDRTTLGGMLFDIFGQGRVLATGLGVQYQPKPPSRIPG